MPSRSLPIMMNVTIRLSDKHDVCPRVLRSFFNHLGLDWRNSHHGFIKPLHPDSSCHFNSLEFFPDTELISQSEWTVEVAVSGAFALMSVNGLPVAATIHSEIRGADGRIAGHAALSNLSIAEMLEALPEDIRHLGIFGCDAFDNLDPLARLGDLITLSLAQCDGIRDIGPLAALRKLHDLDLSGLYRLREINALGKIIPLRRLELNGCNELEDVSALSACVHLESLGLSACREIKNLESLRSLSSLRQLDLFQCSNVEDFSPIASLTALETLNISQHSGPGFNNLELLSGLTELRELDLSRVIYWDSSPSGTQLGNLSALKNLQILKVRSWDRLEDISALAGLRNLEHLNLNDCRALRDLCPLSGLPALGTLGLSGCRSLRDLSPLLSIPNLKGVSEYSLDRCAVDLHGCEALEDLKPLSTLGWITELNLNGCRSIADLKPLSSLANLESLNLEGCFGVSNLVPLAPLKKLAELNLQGAKRVRSVEPLRDVISLRELECDLHPAQTMEIVAHAAWCRRDTTMIEKNGRDWGIEATACGKNSDPGFEGFMVSLCRAFSLLGDHELATHTETLLLRHPELSSAPWKAWLGGTLQVSGVVLYRQRVERVPVVSMPFGMIGGVCVTLPHEEDPAWALQWLEKLEDARAKDARALLGVAPEICLACVRLGEAQALERWLVRFTDPSDPAGLDPVHASLALHQLAAGDLIAAENHIFAIMLPSRRDPVLVRLVNALVSIDLQLASIRLLSIESSALRVGLVERLAAQPGVSEEVFHRLVVAVGNDPDALGRFLANTADDAQSSFIRALSVRLQPERRATLLKIAGLLVEEAERCIG